MAFGKKPAELLEKPTAAKPKSATDDAESANGQQRKALKRKQPPPADEEGLEEDHKDTNAKARPKAKGRPKGKANAKAMGKPGAKRGRAKKGGATAQEDHDAELGETASLLDEDDGAHAD